MTRDGWVTEGQACVTCEKHWRLLCCVAGAVDFDEFSTRLPLERFHFLCDRRESVGKDS